MNISTRTIVDRKVISTRTIRVLNNNDPYTEQSVTITRLIERTRTISTRTIDNEQLIAHVRAGEAASDSAGRRKAGARPDRVA